MFNDAEQSRTGGTPITLYLFEVGTAKYAYTDAEDDMTRLGVPYQAVPILRTAISTRADLDKSTLTVTGPLNLSISPLFVSYPPSTVVQLSIFEGHVGVDEFRIRWRGRVLSVTWRAQEMSLNCEGVSTSGRRPGLRRNYQFGCGHALYGPSCKASEGLVRLSRAVVSVAGDTITLGNDWSNAPAKFRGGLLRWNTVEVRTIREATETTVRASGLRNILPGTIVLLAPGCNRTMEDCKLLHNNIRNFGGFPSIPTKNPFAFSSQFY